LLPLLRIFSIVYIYKLLCYLIFYPFYIFGEVERNMKRKIVGILICMLLIATAVPAVGSLKNNAKNATVPSTPQISTAVDWQEWQKLLAKDAEGGDGFGFSVSLSQNLALIGAPGNDDHGLNSGAAYLFSCSSGDWKQVAKLTANDSEAGDSFGCSVSICGLTALIGAVMDEDNGHASGSAYVFHYTNIPGGYGWIQKQKLLPGDGAANDEFGVSVSLNGNKALIGAWGDTNGVGVWSGSAYVFSYSSTTDKWSQQAKLIAPVPQTSEYFGYSVSLYFDTALIGAYGYNGDLGCAYVFTSVGGNWGYKDQLLDPNGAALDRFGYSVSIRHMAALIGAPGDDDNGDSSGSACVFTHDASGVWNHLPVKITAGDGNPGDLFGYSVSFWYNFALIGAPYDDDTQNDSGSAYVFVWTTTGGWIQEAKLHASDAAGWDYFGCSVSTSDIGTNYVLIGAYGNDDNGPGSGSAYVDEPNNSVHSAVVCVTDRWSLPYVNVTLHYPEPWVAFGVEWLIHVEGGILGGINTTVNGTIDIPIGENITVSAGPLFGLGLLDITAKADNKEKTAIGIIILFWGIILSR